MAWIKADLVPSYEVTPVSGLPGYWQAAGIDPQFEIQESGRPISLRKGFYICEIGNKDNLSQIHNPQFFYDNGQGYDASRRIDLVFQKCGNNLFRAYFVLPENCNAIRFDPTEYHAQFHIGSIRFSRLAKSAWYLSMSNLVFNARRQNGLGVRTSIKSAGKYFKNDGLKGVVRRLREIATQSMLQAGAQTSDTPPNAPPSYTSLSFLKDEADLGGDGIAKFYEYYRVQSAVSEGMRSADFAPDKAEAIDSNRSDVKLIAYYLPQFHPFAQNDEWWGKGFTEWTNVTKAVPRFVGHYQPKLPGELGFYDLRNVEVMRQQAAMAKKFGLSGFCFHFYWFGGTRLMETPLLNFREAEDIDFNYSLCWANENWSRRWDGAEHELLIGQRHSAEDDLEFIRYISRYFSDPRYIRIDGKPVLTVYRPDILPEPEATVKRWRKEMEKLGFPGIYLVATNSFGFTDYRKFGFDALSEFPPHAVEADILNSKVLKYDHRHAGGIFDYASLVRNQKSKPDLPQSVVFPGVIPAWDNVARRPLAGHVFHNSTPLAYRDWLIHAIERVRKTNPEGQRIVMINAWNEWAEGAFLEPDRLNGFAYLWATASAIESTYGDDTSSAKLLKDVAKHNAGFKPSGTHAVAAHVYYQETAEDLKAALENRSDLDIYITIPATTHPDAFLKITDLFPRSFILPVTNCGRDVLPFIKVFKHLARHDYAWVCKVHSKKSMHLGGGNLWRRELYSMLFDGLSTKSGKQTHSLLPKNAKTGIVGAAGSLKSLDDVWSLQNNKPVMDTLLGKLGLGHFVKDFTKHSFFAGTMFWFRPQALKPLLDHELNDDDFGVELGRVDGTSAHAMERLFGIIADASGFSAAELANSKSVSVDISLAKRDRK